MVASAARQTKAGIALAAASALRMAAGEQQASQQRVSEKALSRNACGMAAGSGMK